MKLIDVLKIFLEKYLVPTTLSFVLACLAYFFIPSDYILRTKLGVILYGMFLWVSFFLTVILIKWLSTCLSTKISSSKSIKEHNRYAFEEMRSFVDTLDGDEYNILITMVKSGNAPLNIEKRSYHEYAKLLDSPLLHSSPFNDLTRAHQSYMSYGYGAGIKKYVIKDEYYTQLKYLLNEYGGISHFDCSSQSNPPQQ